ncbi:hypothetical protein AB0I16_06115 [Streptomyces sp. NPDC050703]
MIVAPTALTLAMLVLFALALKASDTAPHPRSGDPEQPEPTGTGAAGR